METTGYEEIFFTIKNKKSNTCKEYNKIEKTFSENDMQKYSDDVIGFYICGKYVCIDSEYKSGKIRVSFPITNPK